MLRMAGKPVGERPGKAPPFGDVALADANLHRRDRMQDRRMFVHVAFTRGKVGLLHHAETIRIEGKSFRSKDQVEI